MSESTRLQIVMVTTYSILPYFQKMFEQLDVNADGRITKCALYMYMPYCLLIAHKPHY